MTPLTELDRLFAESLAQTQKPEPPEVTEHFGVEDIQTGNAGIPCERKEWHGPNERAPLPGYPHLPKGLP